MDENHPKMRGAVPKGAALFAVFIIYGIFQSKHL